MQFWDSKYMSRVNCNQTVHLELVFETHFYCSVSCWLIPLIRTADLIIHVVIHEKDVNIAYFIIRLFYAILYCIFIIFLNLSQFNDIHWSSSTNSGCIHELNLSPWAKTGPSSSTCQTAALSFSPIHRNAIFVVVVPARRPLRYLYSHIWWRSRPFFAPAVVALALAATHRRIRVRTKRVIAGRRQSSKVNGVSLSPLGSSIKQKVFDCELVWLFDCAVRCHHHRRCGARVNSFLPHSVLWFRYYDTTFIHSHTHTHTRWRSRECYELIWCCS